jgi:hypothetical protein
VGYFLSLEKLLNLLVSLSLIYSTYANRPPGVCLFTIIVLFFLSLSFCVFISFLSSLLFLLVFCIYLFL